MVGTKTRKADAELDDFEAETYTVQQVCQMLGVKPKTLASWRNNLTPNTPPFKRVSRKLVLYPVNDFREWLRRQKTVKPDEA